MHKIMYITSNLFICVLGLAAHSMLFILCSPDLRGGRSVLTLVVKFAYICLYVNMMRMGGCVNADM